MVKAKSTCFLALSNRNPNVNNKNIGSFWDTLLFGKPRSPRFLPWLPTIVDLDISDQWKRWDLLGDFGKVSSFVE